MMMLALELTVTCRVCVSRNPVGTGHLVTLWVVVTKAEVRVLTLGICQCSEVTFDILLISIGFGTIEVLEAITTSKCGSPVLHQVSHVLFTSS